MFVCPSCHKSSTILPSSTGGAAALASELGLKLLASLPLDPRVGRACDEGQSLFTEHGESEVAVAYLGMVDGLVRGLAGL